MITNSFTATFDWDNRAAATSSGSFERPSFINTPPSTSAAEDSVSDFSIEHDQLDVEETSSYSSERRWARVKCSANSEDPPCQRSLHVGAILNDKIYVFGGYDGRRRLNDIYEFCLHNKVWRQIIIEGTTIPRERDRHICVVHASSLFIFGGFDGHSRINDFYEFQCSNRNRRWRHISDATGSIPSARQSHAAVVYDSKLYIFGGYDGSYRNDLYSYSFAENEWSLVPTSGSIPIARYRTSLVVHEDSMVLFGGHNGTTQLNDCFVYQFKERNWSCLVAEGPTPTPRDSHCAVMYQGSMFILGGSTGSGMNDFHELSLEENRWIPVSSRAPTSQQAAAPCFENQSNHHHGFHQVDYSRLQHRFCHIALIHHSSIYVFGGYDGVSRLNDFVSFDFGVNYKSDEIPASTLVSDLRSLLLNAGEPGGLGDVVFNVEGIKINAHRALCMRCAYFKSLLTGPMKESSMNEIELPDVKHAIFMFILEYLYTDQIDVPLDSAMELFETADKFGIDRLTKICEATMMGAISVENVAYMLHTADVRHAKSLRQNCLNFILHNFDAVSKTKGFEEMGRNNMELVFEILQKR